MVKTAYGLAAVLAGLLVISSSFAMLYYFQYQQQASANQNYLNELNHEIAAYNLIAAKYNLTAAVLLQTGGSFQELTTLYNHTIALLTRLIMSLNTSSPEYMAGSKALSGLWDNYLKIVGSYKKALAGLGATGQANSVRVLAYHTNIFIDYGNGTRMWYNQTAVQPGWNLYVATLVLLKGNVQATWYPQYQEHFVYGLADVTNSALENKAWFLWTWNSSSSWRIAQVGADQLNVYNDSVFAWTYCQYSPTTYSPSCSAP